MKVAVLLDKANFDRYSSPDTVPADWELIHFGNAEVDENAVIASGSNAILADPMVPCPCTMIRQLPNLRLVQSQGVGYHLFDLEAAREKGVWVANCAGANASAVAEQAIMLMLALLRNLKEFDRMVYEARQAEAKGRCFRNGAIELQSCHVGILGYGAIGRETAKRLNAFGSRVSYYDVVLHPESGLTYLPLEKIYSDCDIISIHLPVTPETTGMINADSIALMKPTALLINTARGEIIDQEALCHALNSGKLGGAGLDTLSPEPVTADNPILNLPADVKDRGVLSPHIGGITDGSFRRYFDIIGAAYLVLFLPFTDYFLQFNDAATLLPAHISVRRRGAGNEL